MRRSHGRDCIGSTVASNRQKYQLDRRKNCKISKTSSKDAVPETINISNLSRRHCAVLFTTSTGSFLLIALDYRIKRFPLSLLRLICLFQVCNGQVFMLRLYLY